MIDFATKGDEFLAVSWDEHIGLGIGTLGEPLQRCCRGIQDVVIGAYQSA